MRVESSVLSVSWIPSEAVQGLPAVPFDTGIAHYDDPPPAAIADLDELRRDDGFRFANELRAWAEVEDGRITAYGQTGQGHLGSSTVRFGWRDLTFAAIALPELRSEEASADSVRFIQTAGGRTGLPAPRRVSHPPFVRISAPLAWTTLALTLHADGRVTRELAGASPFPRHWVYDQDRRVVAKSGLIDFDTWYRGAFGPHSPWGDEDSPAIQTAVETALERELSTTIMRGGAKPVIRTVPAGATLVEQGWLGSDLFLLLDGVLSVEVDGRALADIGPGAVLGERAVLEGGRRTATLRAVTPARVAIANRNDIAHESLLELRRAHRREEQE